VRGKNALVTWKSQPENPQKRNVLHSYIFQYISGTINEYMSDAASVVGGWQGSFYLSAPNMVDEPIPEEEEEEEEEEGEERMEEKGGENDGNNSE